VLSESWDTVDPLIPRLENLLMLSARSLLLVAAFVRTREGLEEFA